MTAYFQKDSPHGASEGPTGPRRSCLCLVVLPPRLDAETMLLCVVHLFSVSTMPGAIDTWANQICAGDVRAIARAITAIEDYDPQAEELLKRIFPSTGRAHVVGVTG